MGEMERLRARLVDERMTALDARRRFAPGGGQLYSEYVGQVYALNVAIEHIDIILRQRPQS